VNLFERMRRRPVASVAAVTGVSFAAAFLIALGVMALLPGHHHATFAQGRVPPQPHTQPSAQAGTHQASPGPTAMPTSGSTAGSDGGGTTVVPAAPAAGQAPPATTPPGGSPVSSAPPAASPPTTIAPGVVDVGVDVPAGTYTAHAAPLACTWKILQGGLLGTILDSALNVGGTQTVHLTVGETFDSTGCGTWHRS
jgi:hypothetical protein